MLVFIATGIGLSVLINVPVVQNKITEKAFVKLDEIFGNDITFSDVHLGLFNKFELKNVLIKDQRMDTLLFAKSLRANMPGIMRKVIVDKQIPIRVRKLVIDEAYLRMYVDSTYTVNFKFVPDTLKARRDTTVEPSPFFIEKMKMKQSTVRLYRFDAEERERGVNLKDLELQDFNMKVSDLRAYTDTIDMSVDLFSFREKSGLLVENIESQLHVTNQDLQFSDMTITSPDSKININSLFFSFNDYQDFADGGLMTKVGIKMSCDKSKLNTSDLGYFADIFEEVDNEAYIAGNFFGTIANLNARNFQLNYSNNTYVNGRFDIIGLPDAKNTFLIFDSKELHITAVDLLSLELPRGKKLNLPDVFSTVSNINYKGNFTGFFTDFVSYGTLETNLGNGEIDISFKPDSSNTVRFEGELDTRSFNVGEMAGMPEMIGVADLDLKIDGVGAIDEGFDVDILGKINNFEVNDYRYQSITVDGNLSQKKFNGELSVEDPNLKMSFDGLFDLSSEVWTYDFTANVLNANLHTLNIHKNDTNYAASFLLKANLKGNSIDEINGDVKLLNSLFSKSDAQIQVYDFGVNIHNDSLSNSLSVQSDFLDGTIDGKYRFSHLLQEYINLVETYVPSVQLGKRKVELLTEATFSYEVKFKNSYPLFQFFLPEYSVSPRTYLLGTLSRNGCLESKLQLVSDEIILKKSKFSKINLNTHGNKDGFVVDLGCEKFDLSKRLVLDNFTVLSSVDSNKFVFSSRWMNWDSTLNKGNVAGEIKLLNQRGERLAALLSIDSSIVVLEDTLWTLKPFGLLYDSSKVLVKDFHLAHNNEFVKVDGKLTQTKTDSLVFLFNNFNFANLNYITRSSTFKFGGVMNGVATMQGLENTLFLSALNIADLEVNNEEIGNTEVETLWNNKKEALEVSADVLKGDTKTLKIIGDVFPSRNNEMNMSLIFDKFRLGFITPFLRGTFSDIQGQTTGLLSLTGTLTEPKLNGNIDLSDAAFTVDYLQTKYHFNSMISFMNNNIVFDQVDLFDKYNNTALLNGMIKSEDLKSFALNLSMQPQNFLCLNTTEDDNSAYYGTAFATGLVRMNGPTSDLKIDITATTDPGTQFSVPLSESEELGEFSYIKIVTTDTLDLDNAVEDYNTNIAGMQLDFDLKVTPDAEVKIIFDPTVGDEITARGRGDLRVAINSLGDFRMHGDYVIQSGDYLFTMKDILFNRKFKVVEGSNLSWTGDPVNADVDINTFYRTKARIGDLIVEDSASTYRHTVDCKLGISGKLKEPDITYAIDLPYAEQPEKDKLNAAIPSNEELGKQFLSLLVLSRFLASNQESGGLQSSGIAEVNASELLSNQLSNWLSQISDELDIGVNYRPGTELSSQELEVALSTQLLNDRLSINGSIDMKTNAEAEQARNIPNLDLDYKITRNGKIRARAYNRATDNEIAVGSYYTQGIGVFYTEEFDSFKEIGVNYRNKRDNKKQQKASKGIDKEGVVREEELDDVD